ncbi:MAG TPA: 2OG-Fe(II) oxygenase, partial [Aquella sp.]|nr:2OG-Fe(II) oxygenase [Aquella sp.]
MKAQITRSLDTLDTKTTMNFFKKRPEPHTKSIATQHKLGYDFVWTIEDFLTREECDKIIHSCDKVGFESLEHSYDQSYRDGTRIVAFDENNFLVETIQTRLSNDKFLDRLNSQEIIPYGFHVDNYKWSNARQINKCLRINKYSPNSLGFGWHRDAQYTESENIRSTYTLLIYLTDNTDGHIKFVVPETQFTHSGLTVKEEIDFLEENGFNSLKILPKCGMAVIFDQSVLHKAMSSSEKKYVLRTDLITFGIPTSKSKNKLESKIEKLTKKLFRQAQYFELEQDNIKSKNLYEICLSLRQTPTYVQKYPIHLEKLLEPIPSERDIFSLKLLSRSGSEYVFKYSGTHSVMDILTSLKVAGMYTISSSVQSLNGEDEGDMTLKMIIMLKTIGVFHRIVDLDMVDDITSKKKFKPFCNYYSKNYGEFDNDDWIENNREDINDIFNEYLQKKYKMKNLDTDHMVESNKDHIGLSLQCEGIEARIGCTGCRLCDCDDDNIDVFTDEELKLQMENFDMVIIPKSSKEENTLSGYIKIETIGTSFNHASCQCERIIKSKCSTEKFINIKIKLCYDIN